jgi:transposase InsO family protein
MSRPGAWHDNAVVERFFWSLKDDLMNHLAITALRDASSSAFDDIVTCYKSKRIHQALGYRTPYHFEAECSPAIGVKTSAPSGSSGAP